MINNHSIESWERSSRTHGGVRGTLRQSMAEPSTRLGVRTSSMSGSMYVHLNIPKTQNFVLQLLDGSFENRPEKLMKAY